MKANRIILVLFIAILLSLGFIIGCSSDSDDSGDSGTGSVQGTVTDSNGAAVSGATCTVTTPDTKAIFTDTTDNEGDFYITNIPENNLLPLQISKTGYLTITTSISIIADQITQVPTSQTVLPPSTGTGNVTGTVSEATNGTAIEGAVVSIGTSQATSSSTGVYSLTGITSGNQTIGAVKSGYENYSSTVNVIDNSTVTHDIGMTLNAPQPGKGHVKGKVVDANGNALSGVTVTAGTTTTATDSNGDYTLMNLDPGQTTLSFAKTGYDDASVNVTVVADQTVTANTVTMTTGPSAGEIFLCSVPRTTENVGRFSDAGICSDDGAFVSFRSNQQLLATHITNGTHAYLYSRSSGTVTLLDADPNGLEGTLAGGASNCTDTFCCGDSSLICFSTNADNILGQGNDANGASDVFVYERSTGNVSRVSTDYSNPLVGGYRDTAKTVGGDSWVARLSQDGTYIVYESQAKNIVAPGYITDGAANHATWNVYRSTLDPGGDGITPGSTLLISGRQLDGKECDPADWGGAGLERTSETPWMSRDGRFIVYESNALPGAAYGGTGIGTAGDTLLNDNAGYRDGGADSDIILCDTQKTPQTWTSFISQNETGIRQAAGANPCNFASVSDDGTLVLFRCEDNLSAWITGNDILWDVWLKNTANGTLQRISDAGSGTRGDSFTGMISRDGKWAAFSSAGNGFVQNDTNGTRDCFIYDVVNGGYQRVNLNGNNEQTENTGGIGSAGPFISGDGDYVVFTSIAKNLTNNVYFTGGTWDVYLKRWK